MKTILALLFISCLVTHSQGQSLYPSTIKSIDGTTINLGSYQGSKVLIVIVPITEQDAKRINEIDSFQNIYGSKIKVIGVLSFEDGFVDSNKAAIKELYTDREMHVDLTEGMYTRKSSGQNQSPLFQWLSSRNANKRFDVDVNGIGQKFFLDPSGKLYAVLPPEMPLFSLPVINNVNRKM